MLQLNTYTDNIRITLFTEYAYLWELQTIVPVSVVYTPLCIILSKRVNNISIVRAGNYFQMQTTVLPYSFECKKSNENDLHSLVYKVGDAIIMWRRGIVSSD